ncbi:fatty acyl-AMP ligase [Lyngbya sp. PCC 8106]|uniref:fatty acyl-AMP ligase n=1 Tax=Lyngbya sp. (strain PCC 8106) TaxID=313612 RepID=UPI0000EA9B63|nr:fatty acyl-AMP ligase [Lyngbya sp. PCC 8106]EAW37309.1 Beta-ketoacyl synthase [Lyngbya sp. PCC 8106]
MNSSDHPEINTLIDLLRNRATHESEQVGYRFLLDGETLEVSLTYQALDQQSRAIAAHLQSICQPGERALLLYQPGLDYISAFFGCLYAGVVAVPAYPPRPNRSLERIEAILADAKATVALTSQSILSLINRQLEQVQSLQSLHWVATDTLETFADHWQEPVLTSDTLAFLQYTSGSTATPKGVMITHGNLLQNLAAIHRCFGHSPQSQGVIWLPPYHDMGLIGGVLQPLYGGFGVVLMSPLMFLQRPLRWLEAISRYQATTSGGPNFAYDLCVRKITPAQREGLDLSSWELAFNGAEPIYDEVIERFTEAFAPYGFRREAFYPCYGLAEATLIVSGGEKNAQPVLATVQATALEQNQVVYDGVTPENRRMVVGCGQSLKDHNIVIVDPQTLKLCKDHQVGEIWVCGPSIAQGYWGKTEETKQNFQATLAESSLGPFLRTGDLGFLANGELFVTGRLKDVIIINGRNYYPQDLERSVEQSHSLVRPNCSASFSVEVNGEERLVIVAEVERHYRENRWADTPSDNGATQSSKVKAVYQSIRRAVSQHHDLQVYAIALLKPGGIPKTSSGKIQRHVCRASFLAQTLNTIEE